ncbi:MAG: diguanylate cyclase [bacterium]
MSNLAPGIINLEKQNRNLQERVDELYALLYMIKLVSKSHDPEEILGKVADYMKTTLHMDMLSILLLNQKNNILIPRVSVGFPQNLIKNIKLPGDNKIIDEITITKQAKIIKDVSTNKKFIESFDYKIINGSFMGLPLLKDNQLIGIINLHKLATNAFSESNREYYMLVADYISNSIVKATLFQEAKNLSNIDDLTQLFNRRYFFEVAYQEIKRAKRYCRKISLLMLDIDHFKHFNDYYGHLKGDYALKVVARILHSHAREADIVGRFGGDEFLMLLPETDKTGCKILAERIRQKIAHVFPFSNEGLQPHLTATIGIATFPDDAQCRHSLLEYADKALYFGKINGRNIVSSTVCSDLYYLPASRSIFNYLYKPVKKKSSLVANLGEKIERIH